jgi:hypothetical protein
LTNTVWSIPDREAQIHQYARVRARESKVSRETASQLR